MRPRKTILLVNANEAQLSVQRFVLRTRGYRVVEASNSADALAQYALGVDLVFGIGEGMLSEWAPLAKRMKRARPWTPILVMAAIDNAEKLFRVATMADAVMNSKTTSAAMILERVPLLIRRHSGPRKSHNVELAAAVAGD